MVETKWWELEMGSKIESNKLEVRGGHLGGRPSACASSGLVSAILLL